MKIMSRAIRLSLFLSLLFCGLAWAQKERMSHQRLSALKMNFIAEKIDCTAEKEAQFWSVYQQYETDLHQEYYQKIKKVRHEYRENLKEMDEQKAVEVLQELESLRQKKEEIRAVLESELKRFLTAKQRLQLYSAEYKFHRNIIKKRKGPKDVSPLKPH